MDKCSTDVIDRQQSSMDGQWCGTVGRAVASDTRGPQFESRHWQNLYIEHLFTVNCVELKI